MDASDGIGSAVIARFLDGRVLKGTTADFSAHKTSFHLAVWGDPGAKAIVVPFGALKAVFFVRTFEGNPKHVEDNDIEKAKGPGRRVIVTFHDGEVVSGITAGYSKEKPGFFMVPVDAASNNARIFVVSGSVKSIAWADTAPLRAAR